MDIVDLLSHAKYIKIHLDIMSNTEKKYNK
jgi:hypothetical protein